MSDYTSTQSGNREKEHHFRFLILPYIKQEAVPPSTEYHFLVLVKFLSIINTASTKCTIWSRPRPTFHINKTCDSLQFYYIYIWKIIILSWDPIGLTPEYFCVCLKPGPCLFMLFLSSVRSSFCWYWWIVDYHCLNFLCMTYWRWCEWDYEWCS